MKMDVLVDLQFGSTGKGALAGFLGVKNGYEVVISANMPNAGHSAYSPDTNQLYVHKVLPSAIFGDRLRVLGIGPGAVFDEDRLVQEWAKVCSYRSDLLLVVHEGAAVVRNHHREAEKADLSRIASTMQGSSAAMIEKIQRKPGVIAKDIKEPLTACAIRHGSFIVVNQKEWLRIMTTGGPVLLEGAQGYSLGINAGFYPYCTSRDCTVARVMADCGMPAKLLGKVYGCARVHPIRVGNTPDGYSGDWYPDQEETTFEKLGVIAEKTTVTGRIRRVATFSRLQIEEAMAMTMPDEVFLNFAQYDLKATGEASKIIDEVAKKLGCGNVTMAGWGPRPADIEEL